MFKIIVSFSLFASLTSPASAGVFGDDLSRCLVKKTSAEDEKVLMRWMFSAFSADPSLAPLSNIRPEQRKQISADAARVYNRLLISDCRTEVVSALKSEGAAVLGPAFGTLGRSAANGLFRSPAAEAELDRLADGFDEQALKKLFGEAGVSNPDK